MSDQNKIHPLKYLGQNYLTDMNIVKKIIDQLNPSDEDYILEIGPGKGSITKELIKKTKKLIVVEIDNRVINDLKKLSPGLETIHSDILKIDFAQIFKEKKEKLRIIGNIPFNLTAPIIFKMINEHSIIKDAVLLVQNEVAQRMVARKSTKEYGILSVLLNHFCETTLCFKISPNVFYPRPKVQSAVVHIIFKEKDLKIVDEHLFIKTVKAAFGNRRKTLKNSFGNSIFKNCDFTGLDFNLSKRAEELEIDDFIKIANYIKIHIDE